MKKNKINNDKKKDQDPVPATVVEKNTDDAPNPKPEAFETNNELKHLSKQQNLDQQESQAQQDSQS